MKHFLLFSFLLLSISFVNAQSVQVSTAASTKGNQTNEFSLEGGKISLQNSTLAYATDAISQDVSNSGLAAAVTSSGASVYEADGSELLTGNYEVIDDGSLQIFVSNNGQFVIRENIANFLLYDSFGTVRQSISNSSQSTEGESISEFAADPEFKTMVLYNPKIVMNGQEGSRVRIARKNGTTTDIYNSQDRAVRFVDVTNNGQYIAVVSYKAGTSDEVLVLDRFGNEINSLNFDQSVAGVNIADDGRFVTIRSNGRAAAYYLENGNRLGSTSFRSTLHFAEFIPEDQVIIGLTGTKSGSVLSDVEVHAVNLQARSIARGGINQSFGITDMIPLVISRDGNFRYTVTGLSQALNVSASF